jgi:hypothetical protein
MSSIEMTGMEKGLLKQCGYKKQTIKQLECKLENTMKISSRTIGNLGGIQAVLNYRVDIGGWEQAYYLTRIDEYTNKKGHMSMAHYNRNGKYIGSVKRMGEQPVLTLCWTIVNENTIHKWEIKEDDMDFKLSPIKSE